ncbi:hypothetical protein D3C76_1271430 [compost metagenome]
MLEVGAEIVDAIAVVDFPFFNDIFCTQSILDNKQRLLVAIVKFEQGNFEPNGVNLPSPFGCRQIRVFHTQNCVACGALDVRLR